MDPSQVHVTPPIEDDDEWDTDGFVIPSLGIEDLESRRTESPLEVEPKSSPPQEEKIYLGPHGAPPSQSKQQQEQSSGGRKQRFKLKLKEADERIRGTGHENKLENIRELVGSQKIPVTMSKGSNRDWLDPHCHESQFERRYP